jgi:hypothetical protein
MGLDAAGLRAQGDAAQAHVETYFNRDVMKARYRQLFEELV